MTDHGMWLACSDQTCGYPGEGLVTGLQKPFAVDPGTPACVMVCKEHTSHGSFLMHFTHVFTPHFGSRDSRLSVSQNSHSIVIVADMCERFASPFSFPHSTSSSSPSWTFLPRTSTSSGAPCISPIHAQDPRKEDCGSMAKSRPPTGYAPKVLTSDEFNVYLSIFQSSDLNNICNLGIDLEESANAEIEDEHIRDAFASPLFLQESEAEADLRQTHHSNKESLFKGAQSVLASTGRRVSGPTQKRGSNQEFDDDRIRTILEIQKKQLLSEAKSEILKYENQASLTEDYIREPKEQD